MYLHRYKCDRDFAPATVLASHHHGLGYPRVVHQNPFDFYRVNVFATGLDQVFRSIDETQTSIGSLDKHVAHMKPATAKFVLIDVVPVPVATEQGRTAHCDLACLPRSNVLILAVYQSPQVETVVGFRKIFRHFPDGESGSGGRQHAGFRRSERIPVRRIHQPRRFADQLSRHKIRKDADDFQSFGTDILLAQGLNQRLDHSRDEHQPPLALFFHKLGQSRYIGAVHDEHLASKPQHMKRVLEGHHVEHRRPGHKAIAFFEPDVDA